MKNFFAKLARSLSPRSISSRLARRFAPRTVRNLEALNGIFAEPTEGPLRFVTYERELRELRREVDALRRDSRRVAELYDVVFEWARQDAANRGEVPVVDSARTDAAVARFEKRRAGKP